MTIEEYKSKVIDLFKNGHPTTEQWRGMAEAVLYASESIYEDMVSSIDAEILPPVERSAT